MNRLSTATSPYLRQHADNPVDWYPWGEEAFARAAALDRPLLISIGYSSCHWCHVMAHESFEDEATASVLNAHFVAVKVDREERPDVDAIYMEAIQALSGGGGWPLNVFCTPEGRPFFAGTYFPPSDRPGAPSFVHVLEAVADAWTNRRGDVIDQATTLTDRVAERLAPQSGAQQLASAQVLLRAGVERFAELFDPEHGGIGTAPKFAQPPMLELLLRAHLEGSPDALDMVETTLLALASGGIYDQLGGGFARYSVDRAWQVPHFEKMLYDQASLGRCYLHAWQITGDERYAQVLEETCAYVLRELRAKEGGLYSSVDADDPGGEGRYYTWTPDELEAVLGPEGAEVAARWYGVTAHGNFEHGRTVLQRAERGDLIRPAEIEAARRDLLAAREQRDAPAIDEKILTEWNAMMAALLAEACAATDNPALGEAAIEIVEFLLAHLVREDGRLLRSYLGGTAAHLATAGDYAWMIECLTRVGELTGVARYLTDAARFADELLARFETPEGGFFLTGTDAERLVVRPTDLYDGVVPSANSLATSALGRLGALLDRSDYLEAAERAIRRSAEALARGPLALAHLLLAALNAENGLVEVVVAGGRLDLVQAVRSAFRPGVVLAWGEPMPTALWSGRTDGRAYVCRNGTCLAPASSPRALLETLAGIAHRAAS